MVPEYIPPAHLRVSTTSMKQMFGSCDKVWVWGGQMRSLLAEQVPQLLSEWLLR